MHPRAHLPLTGAVLIALTLAPAVAAQTEDDLRRELAALRQGQEEIRRQIQELRQLLQPRRAAPAPPGPQVRDRVFDLGANPVRGARSARLTLVEFTDYQ